MGCYAVPALAFLVHKVLQKKKPSLQTTSQNRLSLLLLGGTVFGLIDHAWNGELLFRGENLLLDLLLGFVITVAIIAVWGVMLAVEKWRTTTRATS